MLTAAQPECRSANTELLTVAFNSYFMPLREGAETVVQQCLKISEDEKVVVVNDGNDQDLIDALVEVVSEVTDDSELVEYEELETSGMEPPEFVAEAMKNADVFIAPTKKSISHTNARSKANENGARGATMPTVTKEVWKGALTADYDEIKEISEKAGELLRNADTARIVTESGTDLKLSIPEKVEEDTGIIHSPGDFSNLPAGEAYSGVLEAEGKLVIDHDAITNDDATGAVIEVKGDEIVSVESPGDHMEEAFETVENAKNIAEFGFGTNPKATLIGNVLQDEKVLGTVHVAFGDNTFCFPEDHPRHKEAGIHWDFVCREPTVYFDDQKVLDKGEPVFLDQ